MSLSWRESCLLLQHIRQWSLKGLCSVVTGDLAAGTWKGLVKPPQHNAILAVIATPPAAFTLTAIAGAAKWWQEDAGTCLGYTRAGHWEWDPGHNYIYFITSKINFWDTNSTTAILVFLKTSALPTGWSNIHGDNFLPSNTEFLWPDVSASC